MFESPFRDDVTTVTICEHGKEGWTQAKARDVALVITASLKQGRDPAVERSKRRGTPLLAQFASDFITRRSGALKERTLANYRGLLNKHIAPKANFGELMPASLGRIRLDKVGHKYVAALHQALKETPHAANHVLDFLTSLYPEAQAVVLVEDGFNPTRRIKRYAIQARQRFLDDKELTRLGQALAEAEEDGSESPYAIAAIRLSIFTGCRRDEILTARWEWIDFERGLLNLPDSKTGAKHMHLSTPAPEVLRQLPPVSGNPYIIVGAKQGQRWVNLRHAWLRIRERAELKPKILHDGKMQHVRLHSSAVGFQTVTEKAMSGWILSHDKPLTLQIGCPFAFSSRTPTLRTT